VFYNVTYYDTKHFSSSNDDVKVGYGKSTNVFDDTEDDLAESFKKCTREQTIKNSALFKREPTTCPNEIWYDQWIEQFIRTKASAAVAAAADDENDADVFVNVEIGCNKGTDAILNLRQFTKNERVDIGRFQSLTKFPEFSCSWEHDKWNRAVAQNRNSSSNSTRSNNNNNNNNNNVKYRHYCVEASLETYEPVYNAVKEMGLDKLGLTVHYYAVSSSSWPKTVKFPKISPGQENIGIGMTENPNKLLEKYTDFHDVPVITLDEFVFEQKMEQIDVLKIDTEGNDALVLIGAAKTLLKLKPKYIQFENHGVGNWKTANLKDSIDLLDSLSYDCFWATISGKLIQMTNCFHESYSSFKIWSNVACYHRGAKKLKQIMDTFVVAG